MANTIATQVLEDGPRNSIIKVTITSDASGEITNGVIYDASAYQNDNQNNKLMRITYHLNGFSGTLYWNANTPVQMISLTENHPDDMDYSYTGGLINNAGTGKNGDILLTTDGLASAPAGSTGEIVLYVKKKLA
jgi:hypothetical protein